MAKDREIEQIEAMGSELNVNSYTIQYDPKVKRFFKGFETNGRHGVDKRKSKKISNAFDSI